MRAIEIVGQGGLGDLKLVERPEPPAPSAGQVLVQWHASSLNYHDYLVAIAGLPTEAGRIPLSDGAGEVVAVGPGVERWQVGDRVMSLFFPSWQTAAPTAADMQTISGETVDGFAVERSLVDEQALTRMPTGYSYAQAATLPCAAVTAWRALVVEGRIKAGDSVLVEGSGGMSVFAMQIAAMAGARVYATTSSEEKATRMRAMGAREVVNYRDDEKWGDTVYGLSGSGVDHVLDVGGGATFQQSVAAARVGGHVCCIGILGGPKGTVLFPKLFFKQQRVTGIAVGSRVMQEDMVRAIEVAGMKPIIDRSFGLEELVDAFRYQAGGRHFGKIVIDYDAADS